MDELRSSLKALRRMNVHQRMFVPDLSLYRIMTKDAIRRALEDVGIRAHQREEIATRVVQSGRKIFAILVLIRQPADISIFIETDELQDARIPFKIEALREEFRIPNADEFDEKQWEFTSPIFLHGTLNRCLKDRIVLPFTLKRDVGRGAFGNVCLVELDPDHQELDIFPKVFAQKEMKNVDSHRIELENLSILNHLKHPNIVELLASYTYQNIHNLLFPLAGETLATLLNTGRQFTEFQSNETFLVALAGLSSAIEHVHNFFERRIDLKLIGCHHDLRPQNILVSGMTLILADFGLSTFKESLHNSEALFKEGIGDYHAPECEDLDHGFQPLLIRRSSDIWSFGCIIAEVVAYMAHGKHAVKEFRDDREFRVRSFKLHYFHHGSNKASSTVTDWLSKLEQSPAKSCAMLVGLVRRMLDMDQSERPKAGEVTWHLRLIALSEIATSMDQLFSVIWTNTGSLDAFIEHSRFQAWKYAIGIQDLNVTSHPHETFKFGLIMECLIRVRKHLVWMLSQDENVRPGFAQLCYFNDDLENLLDVRQQEKSRNFFRIFMIENHDSKIIKRIESDDKGLSLDRAIRMRATLKHMTALAKDHSETDTSKMQVESKTVSLISSFGEHSIGQVIKEKHVRQVLVEWRNYARQSPDKAISKELFARLNAIAKQLSIEKPREMRALNCSGYYHNEHRTSFGVLFDIPTSISPDSDPVEPTTLHKLIVETAHRSAKYSPVLDDKFRLAFTLAKSILEFHVVGWLHKNLTALNIAFFPTKATPEDERIWEPYIIGFNHSRPDDPSSFTEGIVSSGDAWYQHPIYRKDTRGYRPEYDYYSFGFILLQIGYWQPLDEITRGIDGNNYDEKLKTRILLLRQYMGRDYCEAVMVCIYGDFSGSKDEDGKGGNKGVFVDFESKVLSRLNRCLTS